ncbi:DUF1203 domain-containing protein [Jannaschia sp. Os4]|uniref:DUF1203 domain-containing protein n=1 Tax=Jannaschia sp. Os4 TaxID=2807617 RepID=UPI0019394AA5|nr:DUF1203 domain-containing protein [Jannaschia sp. Os4]MBM2576538.1 DUF1203 domain-containing protein [Jannaschia sp. Os4]
MRYDPLPTDLVRAWRAGGPDANGQAPKRATSDGDGVPCRHCLRDVPQGRDYLILAHRPFGAPQPYAEVGPIFVCAEDCAAWEGDGVPPVLTTSPDYLIKGYSADERIAYGTGAVVAAAGIDAAIAARFDDPRVAFVDVRSARNNCFQTRVRRPTNAA